MNVGRFGVRFLPCGFATVCDKTRWHGYAQESVIYIYMLERCCCARLQPEVAKRNVEDARKVVSEHMQCHHSRAMREAGGCKTHCAGCAKRRLVLQKLQLQKR